MFERFTDRARKVMALANGHAQRFNHEYIGTEHVLLAVVEEGHGVAADVLKSRGIDLPTVQIEVEKLVKSGPDMVTAGKLPQTPRAKKMIEYAIEEARSLDHSHVGTEHLLLGLLRVRQGVAAQVLTGLGLNIEQARDEVLKLVGPDAADDADAPEPDSAAPKNPWVAHETRQQHLTFWRTLGSALGEGDTLINALTRAKAAAASTDFEPVVDGLLDQVGEGRSVSEAMAANAQAFSQCEVAMARAGEVGGIFELLAEQIALGIDARSLPLVGESATPQADSARYWRVFGLLLRAGVPVLDNALALAADVVASNELRMVLKEVHESVKAGKSISASMQGRPILFPEDIRLAVSLGEQTGELDEAALRIAEGIETRDTASALDRLRLHCESLDDRTIQCANTIIADAAKLHASDIHFDATRDGLGRVRYRVDGVLHDIEKLDEGVFSRVVRRVKQMADLDLAQQSLPQDGRISLKLSGKGYDLRISTAPAHYGERLVVRLLDRRQVKISLSDIGLADADLDKIRQLCHLPHGIVIANGPAGSGKTTLLHAMLLEADSPGACVITVEDPVEYAFDDIAQIQVNPSIGLTYARTVRSILRQDPDVIMVGELRDLEMVQLVCECALTGHLVLTTMHANTAPGAIRRLIDIGIEPYQVNSALAAIVSQRLVRILCDKCKQPAEPATHSMPPEAVEFISNCQQANFCQPVGCDECQSTGYRGRTAIHEILVMNDAIRRVIGDTTDAAAIRRAAVKTGMKTMLYSGVQKAAQGITSIEEVLSLVPHGPII